MTKKQWILGVIGLVALTIGIAGYLYMNPRVGFTYYEPTYLPPGVSVKAKRISVFRDNYIVEQNFRTEDWVYIIQETPNIYPIEDVQQDYDPTSVQPTCNSEKSPNGATYRLCHWIDYGRIDVQEIKFVKNGTLIDVRLPSSLEQKISKTDIAKFVDSFEKKSTRGFQVLRSNGV